MANPSTESAVDKFEQAVEDTFAQKVIRWIFSAGGMTICLTILVAIVATIHKGPYILEAISELRTILNRMESHSSKNKNALRPLRIARKNLKRIKSLWQPSDTL